MGGGRCEKLPKYHASCGPSSRTLIMHERKCLSAMRQNNQLRTRLPACTGEVLSYRIMPCACLAMLITESSRGPVRAAQPLSTPHGTAAVGCDNSAVRV